MSENDRGGIAKRTKATDCKSVIVGSNPTAASILSRRVAAMQNALCGWSLRSFREAEQQSGAESQRQLMATQAWTMPPAAAA